MFKHVLVAADASDHARSALRLAAQQAKDAGAHLTVLGVVSAPTVIGAELDIIDYGATMSVQLVDALREATHERLEEWIGQEVPAGVAVTIVVREGGAAEEITAQAAEGGHDLVVIGRHGHTGLRGALLGSVTRRVVRTSPVPVLVAR